MRDGVSLRVNVVKASGREALGEGTSRWGDRCVAAGRTRVVVLAKTILKEET
jgi:hypothetical protein